jgi:hypothetical protein
VNWISDRHELIVDGRGRLERYFKGLALLFDEVRQLFVGARDWLLVLEFGISCRYTLAVTIFLGMNNEEYFNDSYWVC